MRTLFRTTNLKVAQTDVRFTESSIATR